ncbi:MAG: PAS domain-containing protein [Desulfobulbaceae bacterium]|nr:PAS domain-containing protein [Desulfobulbaceae bacterium]
MKNDSHCKSEVSDLEIKDRLDSAEKALRQSEERFKLAMEATQDGIWDWNVETNDVYLSPNWSSLLGLNSNQFQLDIKAWSKLIHIDDKTTVFKAFLDCLNNHNDDFEVEYRIRVKNGDWMWILGRGKVVTRDRRGHAVRMVGTQTDITRLKQGEVDSATQADTLNIIFNSTPNILILVNTKGRIDKINRSGIDFSGKTEEELIGCLGGDALRCCHSFEGKGCGTTHLTAHFAL